MISKKYMAAILFVGASVLSPQFANAGELLKLVEQGDFVGATKYVIRGAKSARGELRAQDSGFLLANITFDNQITWLFEGPSVWVCDKKERYLSSFNKELIEDLKSLRGDSEKPRDALLVLKFLAEGFVKEWDSFVEKTMVKIFVRANKTIDTGSSWQFVDCVFDSLVLSAGPRKQFFSYDSPHDIVPKIRAVVSEQGAPAFRLILLGFSKDQFFAQALGDESCDDGYSEMFGRLSGIGEWPEQLLDLEQIGFLKSEVGRTQILDERIYRKMSLEDVLKGLPLNWFVIKESD
ncbi:hypothetical protein HOD08_00445 [bacterium]|nr:hypothetical protein [bacterium]